MIAAASTSARTSTSTGKMMMSKQRLLGSTMILLRSSASRSASTAAFIGRGTSTLLQHHHHVHHPSGLRSIGSAAARLTSSTSLSASAASATVASYSPYKSNHKAAPISPPTGQPLRGLATTPQSPPAAAAATPTASWNDEISRYDRSYDTSSDRTTMKPYPLSDWKSAPPHIARPPYAATGQVPFHANEIVLHNDAFELEKMRHAARVARKGLNLACALAKPGVTTDEIDSIVHDALLRNGNAYPSPLNYSNFPKSLCSSVNEVICHGIPDMRALELGDIVSFDVSCFVDGVHGDNCATVIVGDHDGANDLSWDDIATAQSRLAQSQQQSPYHHHPTADWRGVAFRTTFNSPQQELQFVASRRLVHAARESLYAAIDAIGPGACLSDVGGAIQDVADAYGYSTVEKYRGHGIHTQLHLPPFVKHYRNNDKLELVPGMIFTIEPMLVEGAGACHEWGDAWTVVTDDGGMAAQFEHTVLITDTGVEILTQSDETL